MSANDISKSSNRSLSNSRAQVTIFIVVGLVLLGIAGILVSLSNSLQTDSLTQSKPQDERVKFDAAVKIIRDCITASTQTSLTSIALQGGANDRDTLVPVPAQIGRPQESAVSIGITRMNEGLPNPTNLPVDLGELRSAPIDPLQNQKVKTLGGVLTLPKLCDRFGPNAPSNPDVVLTCEISSYGYDGNTVQNKLAYEIQQNTIACAQKSQELLDDIGQDVSTYFGILPQVIFGDNDVTVAFTFDTNVSIRQSNFSFHEATVKIPARYKRLYNFLYAVLDQDSKNILFDKTNQYTQVNTCNYPGSSACWSDGFVLSVTPNIFIDPSTNKVFDLVTVTDRNSSIGGKTLTFRTAVENRRPVMDPLKIYDIFSFPAISTHPDSSDWQRRYTTYAQSGQTILLKPLAYDFDEEGDLTYTYSGWKADEDSRFLTGTASNPDGGCSPPAPEDTTWPTRCDYWDETYLEYSATISSNKWQESGDYITGIDNCDGTTSRCASFTTNPDGTDLGPHSVTILARDRGGLTDAIDAAILIGTD